MSPSDLVRAKRGQRISVVIPAHDEGRTIGAVVRTIREVLVEDTPLVDELVVIDSDSTDDTATVAARAGACVRSAAWIRPDLGARAGKGEALWKSQFVSSGDLLVFIDADLTTWGPHFVSRLVEPLLSDGDTQLVKGFYDRVLDGAAAGSESQGGRVTELVARPLLSLLAPELRDVVQPLAGEWAIRRSALAELSLPIGYGVEMSALLDVHRAHGRKAIAQVDLGARGHVHQPVHDLAVMSAEIMAVTMRRAGVCLPRSADLRQFDPGTRATSRTRPVPLAERPPASTVGPAPSGEC